MHPNEDFSDLRAREVVVAGAAVTGDLLATYGCGRKLWPAVTAWGRRAVSMDIECSHTGTV